MTSDDSIQHAIVECHEFRAFCADLAPFMADGSREGAIRVSASRLATTARRHGWDSEQLIGALHNSGVYPAPASAEGGVTASYRYTLAVDRLLYAFFRYLRTGETLIPSEKSVKSPE